MPGQRTTSRHARHRLRKDGAPPKAPARIPLRHIQAFIEEQAAFLPSPRHRPRKGTVTLVQAIMQRFDISRSTAMRSLRELARRQAEELGRIAGPLTPESAGVLASLARQYQGRMTGTGTVSGAARETVSDKIQGPHPLAPQELTQEELRARGRLPVSESDLVDGIVAYLQAADPVVIKRVRDLLPPPPAGSEPASGRGLEAIGLVAATSVPTSPMATSKPSVFDPAEGLLDAMDAYESMKSIPESWVKVWAWLRASVQKRGISAG